MTAEETLSNIAGCLYTNLTTQRHSYDLARSVDVPGDIVECGVAAGGNFASMIVGAMEAGHNRRFWGFDSFQGVQLAGPMDEWQPGIDGPIKHDVSVPPEELLVSSGISSHSRDAVISNLERWGLWGEANIELIEGWVQHTLPVHADRIKQIAILRLDMDIYDATKCALEHLWPKVVSRGIVIVDDWELAGARKALVNYLWSIDIDYQQIQFPRYVGEQDQAYFVKP